MLSSLRGTTGAACFDSLLFIPLCSCASLGTVWHLEKRGDFSAILVGMISVGSEIVPELLSALPSH